ncbi:MAG: NAD-dependent malic enzyme [Acidimicrobiales bacterium]
MNPTANASYSITLEVELEHRPGTLGRLASAIGGAGGNILGLDLLDVVDGRLVRAVTVLAGNLEHARTISQVAEGVEGVRVVAVTDRTLRLHRAGKIEVRSKAPITTRDDLSMVYTPGVARVSRLIAADARQAHRYTLKGNTVAVVTDGTAVLGLGDIGPEAALPVMEGKAALFKEFAGVDAFPICLRVASADELVDTVERLEPAFGGINLEDVAAPRCFEVEERLKASLDIPVFHDDQHGTAVVVLAALRNAAKVVGRDLTDLSVVIVGVGAAGVAIAKILDAAGVPDIVGVDRQGAIWDGRSDAEGQKAWLAEHTNPSRRKGRLAEVLPGTDVFVGVSGPDILGREEVASMSSAPIVFALANPDPEVMPEEIEGVAAVVATGRSDYPNQINNVLCFPGIFRGALDAGASAITEGMKLAAADAIAESIPPEALAPEFVVPSVFDRAVVSRVAAAVAAAARSDGVARDFPDAANPFG